MSELDPQAEQQLADMSAEEFDLLIARVRPPDEPADPRERAAKALRNLRGVDRKTGTTKEQAAAALRQYSAGSRDS
ncbi:hypothetical protein BMW24_008700 [Mycobacterium heckeshornense]|jgi:hypothetical protein|uniref:Uncharacterized protein n=1 Tax=Mycobacterium heckeshornense TaxID=110505 RepID=A0A2G8BDS7_9MYCO|nr:hypothetical protein [Mycobacterium heckeshornense]KMV15286.1 hypothetical protein ACT16_22955 [Mycobacterium heckeshornense]MCV7035110.1 hypothetical protein [Mycobacterium heckeshornense]PIJ35832.1 hypothetical protein BMW24_008700 [Mycobacterium heckeshornense]BCO36012.1 hypothetical protein MHEC_24450 [Mycobacterium heckeshornense]